jgi:hypothetical protein
MTDNEIMAAAEQVFLSQLITEQFETGQTDE